MVHPAVMMAWLQKKSDNKGQSLLFLCHLVASFFICPDFAFTLFGLLIYLKRCGQVSVGPQP
jgi:hypothetical protein